MRSQSQTTDRIIRQCKSLVRAIEAPETIEPTGPIESAITWLLLKAYRRRRRMLSPSQAIGRLKEFKFNGQA